MFHVYKEKVTFLLSFVYRNVVELSLPLSSMALVAKMKPALSFIDVHVEVKAEWRSFGRGGTRQVLKRTQVHPPTLPFHTSVSSPLICSSVLLLSLEPIFLRLNFNDAAWSVRSCGYCPRRSGSSRYVQIVVYAMQWEIIDRICCIFVLSFYFRLLFGAFLLCCVVRILYLFLHGRFLTPLPPLKGPKKVLPRLKETAAMVKEMASKASSQLPKEAVRVSW